MRTLGLALVLLLTLALPQMALAHYFWVQPSTHKANDKESITVRLFVGHSKEVKEYPHVPPAFVRFEATGPSRTVAMAGRLGDKPAGRVALVGEGVHTLVYYSNHSYGDLEPARFEKYLRDKGLQNIIDDRVRRGESNLDGKESYARYAKSLVQVGKSAAGFDSKVGIPLEITAQDNPMVLRKKKTSFVVELNGKPLANATVFLVPLDDLDKSTPGVTDSKGRVSFPIAAKGKYMVATVYMRRAPKGINGDWQSFWGNLSFETF